MKRTGFTLIELLIVIAIIAILALIAIPNFIEAQTRAKVSRAQADMRSIATGLQAYQVDNQVYPPSNYWISAQSYADFLFYERVDNLNFACLYLTTPIAYMTNIMLDDPFIQGGNFQHQNAGQHLTRVGYGYVCMDSIVKAWGVTPDYTGAVGGVSGKDLFSSSQIVLDGKKKQAQFCLLSAGPDKIYNYIQNASPTPTNFFRNMPANFYKCQAWSNGGLTTAYDPTNGTVSHGDIIRSE